MSFSFDFTLKNNLTEDSFVWHLLLFYVRVEYAAANIRDIVKAFVREYGGLTPAWLKLDATLRFNFGQGLGNPPPELPAASRTPPDSQDSWAESADLSDLRRANEPVVGGVKSVVAQHGFGKECLRGSTLMLAGKPATLPALYAAWKEQRAAAAAVGAGAEGTALSGAVWHVSYPPARGGRPMFTRVEPNAESSDDDSSGSSDDVPCSDLDDSSSESDDVPCSDLDDSSSENERRYSDGSTSYSQSTEDDMSDSDSTSYYQSSDGSECPYRRECRWKRNQRKAANAGITK